jgi:vacuolar protein sorting-associated protein 13A/C
LKISVFGGNVHLTNLKVRPEGLAFLKLPITVAEGFIGKLTLQANWTRLGSEPVRVVLEDVYLLAAPLSTAPQSAATTTTTTTVTAGINKDGTAGANGDKAVVQARAAALAADEASMLAREGARGADDQGLTPKQLKAKRKAEAAANRSFLAALSAQIVGNVQVSVRRVHVRYQDASDESTVRVFGVAIDEASAVTTDASGNETFVDANSGSGDAATHKWVAARSSTRVLMSRRFGLCDLFSCIGGAVRDTQTHRQKRRQQTTYRSRVLCN